MLQQKGTQFKDITGNVLAHQHNAPRPMHASDLPEEYQQIMVSESGAHQLNSMQSINA